MHKIAFVALLIAVSLQAQTAPAAQEQPKAATPATEGAIKIFDLPNYRFEPPKVVVSTACAVPLLQVQVPDKEQYAIKTAPANSAMDPKMVVRPPLPACAPSAEQPKLVPSKPAQEKK